MKGEYNGTCNITACVTGMSATWYNHSTRAYYCPTCAKRLNTDPYNKRDADRLYGHDLLIEGKFILYMAGKPVYEGDETHQLLERARKETNGDLKALALKDAKSIEHLLK